MSCGPTNSLQKLSHHTQLDRSLHADQQLRLGNQRPDSFRTGQSNQLESDYQRHLQQNQQAFNPTFQQQNLPQRDVMMHHYKQQAQQSQQAQHQSGAWANDFASLSISSRGSQHQQQHQHNLQKGNDWSSQFMSQAPQLQQQQQQQQRQFMQQSFTPQSQLSFNHANNILNNQFQNQQLNQSQHYRTEHQEVHDIDRFHNQLEDEFSRLEQDFIKTEEIPIDKPLRQQNEQFKSVAKEVANVMNTSKDEKFANSKFLQLMNMVSAGQVELNDDESKLIDHQGNDIHKQQLEPSEQPNLPLLESQNNELSSAFENTQRDPEIEELRDTNQRLPDPLVGLTAEDLSTPFESAKKAGQIHGEKYTWDDVYDDYRNDDSSF